MPCAGACALSFCRRASQYTSFPMRPGLSPMPASANQIEPSGATAIPLRPSPVTGDVYSLTEPLTLTRPILSIWTVLPGSVNHSAPSVAVVMPSGPDDAVTLGNSSIVGAGQPAGLSRATLSLPVSVNHMQGPPPQVVSADGPRTIWDGALPVGSVTSVIAPNSLGMRP